MHSQTSIVVIDKSPIVRDTGVIPNGEGQHAPIITNYFFVCKDNADDETLERAIDSFAQPLLRQKEPIPMSSLMFYEQTYEFNKQEILSWPLSERGRRFDYYQKNLIVEYQFGYNHKGKFYVDKYLGLKYLK